MTTRSRNPLALRALVTGALSVACGVAQALPLQCGTLKNAYGPFDNRTIPLENRNLVESAHFTPDVEGLVKGNSSTLGGDIGYLLRAIPNHPRGLYAMERLGRKLHTETPPEARYSVECFFLRGVEFAPDDPTMRMLYGTYLKNRKRMPDALREADAASQLEKDPSGYELDYNLGLLYFDLGKYDQALSHADRAYALGAPFPGLRRKLDASGHKVTGKPAPVEPGTPPVTAPAEAPSDK